MKRFATIVALVSLVLLAVFLLYPLALVLDASIRIDGTGAFTFGNYAAIVKSRYYLGSKIGRASCRERVLMPV